MDKFKSDVYKVLENKKTDPISFNIDQNQYVNISKELEKLINLSNSNLIEKSFNFKSNILSQKDKKAEDESLFHVTVDEFFNKNCPRKFLHFFQNNENYLHILNLNELKFNNGNPVFERIRLNIDFQIPRFHKSIATNNGDIYLTGGSLFDRKSQYIYVYDFNRKTLISVATLAFPRSSHAVCFHNGIIINYF